MVVWTRQMQMMLGQATNNDTNCQNYKKTLF